MALRVEKHGKLTYYPEGERSAVCTLVTEAQADGNVTIYFAKLTSGYSARSALGWDQPVWITLQREVPLVSHGRSGARKTPAAPIRPVEAEIAEMPADSKQKALSFWWTRPVARPSNNDWHTEYLPGHGLPCQSTMHLVDVLDQAASCEFYSVALLQRAGAGAS